MFCAADGAVAVNPPELAAVHQQFGDYAAAVLLASRYALATLDAIGVNTVGPGGRGGDGVPERRLHRAADRRRCLLAVPG